MNNDDLTTTARLLPWTGPDGKPCFLVTGGNGYLSKVADQIEAVQLDMADDLLGHASDLLADSRATAEQLRYLLALMIEALTDVRRVAVSRGGRLPVCEGSGTVWREGSRVP